MCGDELNVWLTIFGRSRADGERHYTMPARPTLANYNTSTGTRSSHTYEYIQPATMLSALAPAPKSPDGGNRYLKDNYGYRLPTFNEI